MGNSSIGQSQLKQYKTDENEKIVQLNNLDLSSTKLMKKRNSSIEQS